MSEPAALDEGDRLEAVRRTALLDTPPEEAYDRVTRLAARLLDAPIALVTLIEPERQFMKSVVGAPAGLEGVQEVPLSYSFCRHVVAERKPVVIRDAREHRLGDGNLAVSELGMVAYAGFPVRDRDGQIVATLCVLDYRPRSWSEDELGTLRDLADSVAAEIALRQSVAEALELVEERRLLAREINDRVLQRLSTAKLALEVSEHDVALAALEEGIEDARALVESALTDADVRPGGLRRLFE